MQISAAAVISAEVSINAGYWLCSAVAQAFAALTALTGLFAVYKLQSIRQEKDDIRTHALFALRRTRNSINSQPGTLVSPIEDEPVPAGGEHGWVEIRLSYDREYAPKLASMKSVGGERARWADDMERFFQATFKQYGEKTSEESACNRWAATLTVADGLVTLVSLTLIPYIAKIGCVLNLILSAVLILAGLALFLTLYACVSILRGGYLWPLAVRRTRVERNP